LSHLLFNVLGYPVIGQTSNNNASVDRDSLDKIIEQTDSIMLKALAKYRQLIKLKNTYLEGFKSNAYDGIIHPSFNLHTVATFRSSSSSPNFQNNPKRSDIAKKYIRTVFIPDEGHMLEELDFSSLEVNIGECYHKDKNMYRYLTDTSSSMHTDVGMMLFLRKEGELRSSERTLAKGGYVFPVFYGSNAVTCAKSIWADMDSVSKEHLASKGYTTLEKFTELVRAVDDDFWNVRFKEYGEWKQKNWDKYQKTGSIELYSGFKTTKPMTTTQAGNIAIQGSAFHCLLWLLIYVQKELKKRKMHTRITGQIHDSMVLSVYPPENDILHEIISNGLYALKEEWQWINVPLKLNYEQTGVNGNWNELEYVGEISC
jgi:DNA polymerase I